MRLDSLWLLARISVTMGILAPPAPAALREPVSLRFDASQFAISYKPVVTSGGRAVRYSQSGIESGWPFLPSMCRLDQNTIERTYAPAVQAILKGTSDSLVAITDRLGKTVMVTRQVLWPGVSPVYVINEKLANPFFLTELVAQNVQRHLAGGNIFAAFAELECHYDGLMRSGK